MYVNSDPNQLLKKGLFYHCGDKLHNNKLQEVVFCYKLYFC